MVRLFALVLCSVIVSTPIIAAAQDPGAPRDKDAVAIQGVIRSQIDAFQNDDAVAAYQYASPGIQRAFPTPAIFMDMVRNGYRPVYRPQLYEFRELELIGGRIVQRVLFGGPDGKPVMALYSMQLQDDGRWLISGVRLVYLQDETASRKPEIGWS